MPTKCDPSDPRRCQARTDAGQCEYKAESGTRHCSAHSGLQTRDAEDKRSLILRDAEFDGRVNALSGPKNRNSLRQEIGLVSSLLEDAANHKNRDAMTPRIQSLIDQSMKLKQADQKMQVQHAVLLSKVTVLHLGRCVGDIVTEELRDVPGYEEIVDRIVGRLADVIANETNIEDK